MLFLVIALITLGLAFVADKAELGRDAVSFVALKGKLRLPTRGELINRFGTPRSDSRLRWKVLFIRGTNGEKVRAVASGRVVFVEWMRGVGNLMILDHGQSYLTIFGNDAARSSGRFGQDRQCRGHGRQ